MSPEELFPGSVSGMLEAINLHSYANTFRIYPDFGADKITCFFPARLTGDAVGGVSKFVEVRGVLHYRQQAAYPHAIDVDSIHARDDAESVSLHDLDGIAPDLTRGLGIGDYLDALRDAKT